MSLFRTLVCLAALALAAAPGTGSATVANFQSLVRTTGPDLAFSFNFAGWDGGPEVIPVSPFFTSPGATFREFGDAGAGIGLGGSGLGTIVVDITRGAGAVGTVAGTFHAFFDLEIREATTTFFNEFAAVSGATGTGGNPDSFEVDEPGFLFGDIDLNFRDGTLDNTNAVPIGSPDDVAVALGWDLSLGIGESAMLTIVVSYVGAIAPGSSFSILHSDDLVPDTVTYSGVLSVTGATAVPEPGTLVVFVMGLLGVGLLGWRRNRAATWEST